VFFHIPPQLVGVGIVDAKLFVGLEESTLPVIGFPGFNGFAAQLPQALVFINVGVQGNPSQINITFKLNFPPIHSFS
jgi:hypothetical protein